MYCFFTNGIFYLYRVESSSNCGFHALGHCEALFDASRFDLLGLLLLFLRVVLVLGFLTKDFGGFLWLFYLSLSFATFLDLLVLSRFLEAIL